MPEIVPITKIVRASNSDTGHIVVQWVTSLFVLTFAERIRWAKVRSEYLLKPKSEVISLSESLMYKSMV